VLLIRTGARLSNPWRPWAVIPAKRFARAKTRLRGVLDGPKRSVLASGMFERVMDACAGCGDLTGTLVATDGDDVAALGIARGAAVLRDTAGSARSLSRVIDHALSAVAARGGTHALVIMADLPWLRGQDVRELLAELRHADLVLAPDRSRRGTSALGVRLQLLTLGVRTRFGHADSLQRHVEEANRLHARRSIVHNPRVAFDIDAPDDLWAFSHAPTSCGELLYGRAARAAQESGAVVQERRANRPRIAGASRSW
jgi:2-phospho-L-lactate/phosphoenolpyruvate guanylyltransferase